MTKLYNTYKQNLVQTLQNNDWLDTAYIQYRVIC